MASADRVGLRSLKELDSTAGNVPSVAGCAGLGILPSEPLGVEAGTVGVEPTTALGRVADQTTPLRVTADATFEILPGGDPVVQPERGVRVVIALPQHPAS